jgi:hypothetical protein
MWRKWLWIPTKGLFSIIFGAAMIEVFHHFQLYPDRWCAELITTTPSKSQVELLFWSLAALLGAAGLSAEKWVPKVYASFSNRGKSPPSTGDPKENTYLGRHRDSEIDQAIFQMAHRSAWGRWFAAQHLANNGTAIDDKYLMMIATSLVVDEAVNGNLEIRGRPPNGTEYEVIPKEQWRLAHLEVKPDLRRIWGISAVPRADVDPNRIGRLLSYDSLIVNSHQFESLWSLSQKQTDAARKEFLKQARKKGADPVEIAKLS